MDPTTTTDRLAGYLYYGNRLVASPDGGFMWVDKTAEPSPPPPTASRFKIARGKKQANLVGESSTPFEIPLKLFPTSNSAIVASTGGGGGGVNDGGTLGS